MSLDWTAPLRLTSDPMQTFREHWPCPFDGCDGEMRFSGQAFTTMDTSYQHVCADCKRIAWLTGRSFPRIVHRSVNSENET